MLSPNHSQQACGSPAVLKILYHNVMNVVKKTTSKGQKGKILKTNLGQLYPKNGALLNDIWAALLNENHKTYTVLK